MIREVINLQTNYYMNIYIIRSLIYHLGLNK
jgi:hypothetical protein